MCACTHQPDGPVEQAPSFICSQQVCTELALTHGNQVTLSEGVDGGSWFSFDSKAQFAFQLEKHGRVSGIGSAALLWLR